MSLVRRSGVCLAIALLAAILSLSPSTTLLWAQEPAAPAAEAELPAEEPAAEEPPADAPAEEPMSEEPAAEEPAMEAEPAAVEGDEPAMDAEEPGMEAEEGEEEKPKPAARRARPARGGESEVKEPVAPTDPAVLAVLESNPTTPAELLRAINVLVGLGQAPAAQPFVEQLIKQKLDVDATAALVQRFNSATLMKLARDADVGPTLAPFIDDVLKSALAYRRDPKRLAAWAKQLSDPDETLRAQATMALVRAREAAVAPLIDILADPKRANEHRVARQMLVALDDAAVAPLLGVLESPDPALKRQVIDVLGQLRASDAVGQLLAPLLSPTGPADLNAAAGRALANIAGSAPNHAEALRLLEHAARRPLEQSRNEEEDEMRGIEVWHWNAKRKQSMPLQYTAAGGALARSVRLARDLYLLDLNNAANRRLYLLALLQSTKLRLGLDKPLATGPGTPHDVAGAQGAEVLEGVLAEAMSQGFLPAATAAAEILGDVGNAELLTHGGASPSPLAKAAASSDRRLRFAATGAIMKFKPTRPFAGSSNVTDSLGFFASALGPARVLVVHPRSGEAQKMAGLAMQMGYDADIATNGRQAFELATASPDYEFVLIHSMIDRPPADELLLQLRRDSRTAMLPIGLVAPLEGMERVERYARRTPRTEAFLQPQNEAEMQLFSQRVLARAGRAHVSHEVRKYQAIVAMDWLVELSQRPQRAFDLRRLEPVVVRDAFVPDLSRQAIMLLGQWGTAKGQRTLLELADLAAQNLETRQAAVAAFADSVRKHGLLLTSDEILRQYDLYNGNGGRDADTHLVLGAVLNAIERRELASEE